MLPVARLVLVKAMRRACDPTMRRRRFCPPLLYQLHKRYLEFNLESFSS